MRKYLRPLAALVIGASLLALQSPTQTHTDAPGQVDESVPSAPALMFTLPAIKPQAHLTTTVEGEGARGSATILGELSDGVIYALTAQHVLDKITSPAHLWITDDEVREVSAIECAHIEYDMCMVAVDDAHVRTYDVIIGEAAPGDLVAYRGLTSGETHGEIVETSTVVGRDEVSPEGEHLFWWGVSSATLSSAPGDSGAGIFNQAGELVGMLVGSNAEGTSVISGVLFESTYRELTHRLREVY